MIAMASGPRGWHHRALQTAWAWLASHRSLRRDSLLARRFAFTCNDRGLCRWPVRLLPGSTLRMGPPEPVAPITPRSGSVHLGLAANANGRRDRRCRSGAARFDAPRSGSTNAPSLAHTAPKSVRSRHQSGRKMGGNFRIRTITGLRARQGMGRHERPVTGGVPARNSHAAFSPDSQWIAVYSRHACDFFERGRGAAGRKLIAASRKE